MNGPTVTPINAEPAASPSKGAEPSTSTPRRPMLSPANQAALIAAWHSTYITAGAVLGGLIANWYATGSHGTLPDYIRANATGWIVANMVAPAARAYWARRNVKIAEIAQP